MLIPQGWELVIGLETHVQLQTRSKIFSGASTAFGAEPNRQACAVDLGLPGVLPVLNREAVALAIRFGLAVGGQIAQRSIFARKNYFYPDLPKGYQISQYEIPVVSGGSIDIGDMRVELTRAHLEEDAGKSLHEDYAGFHRYRFKPCRYTLARNRFRAANALSGPGGGLRKTIACLGGLAWDL